MPRRNVVCIFGPKGSGKDTFSHYIASEVRDTTEYPLFTSRAPREHEEGKKFLSEEEFLARVESGNIDMYGTASDGYYVGADSGEIS